MESDEWPRIFCKRFKDESDAFYALRSARIREIISAFRRGRVAPDIAENVEQELIALQRPLPLVQSARQYLVAAE